MPGRAFWAGKTVSVFSCTSCADEDHTIPEMLKGPLRNAEIPRDFLSAYQTNFAVLVFDSEDSIIQDRYTEKIEFLELGFSRPNNLQIFGRVGGKPQWFLEDEAPGRYANTTEMKYLFQINEGHEFTILQNTPPQATVDYGFNCKTIKNYYHLFNKNYIYFYGSDNDECLVYILTQID